MSEHDRLREEIPGWAAGRLDPETQARIETHLAACDECGAAAGTARALAAAADNGTPADADPHPEPALLARWAAGDRPPEAGELVEHLGRCDSCTLEVEAWRRRAAGAATRVEGRVRSTALWRIAAILVVGGLVGLFGPGLLRRFEGPGGAAHGPEVLPGDETMRGAPPPPDLSPPPDLPPPPGAGTAPRRANLLDPEETRAAGDDPVVLVAASETLVSIHLRIARLMTGGPDDAWTIALVDAAGGTVWRQSLDTRALEERRVDGDLLLLLVPRDRLAPARYTLRLFPAGGPEGRPILERAFRSQVAP